MSSTKAQPTFLASDELMVFAAATQRSVATALIHAVGKGKLVRLFSSVHDAAPWFARALGETCPSAGDAVALLEVLEAVRAPAASSSVNTPDLTSS